MENAFECNLISPEKILFSKKVEFVACPTEMGEIGIMSNHAPLVATVGTGLVRINQGGAELRFAVDKGFIEVRDNNVSILVTRAKTPENIVQKEITEKIEELKKTNLGNIENLRELEWLKAQLQIAR
jgi:F-type H+-transporting ATPase subunit epsilon